MGMFKEVSAGGDVAAPAGVFINGPEGLVQLKCDVSAFVSSDWVNTEGYILPGTPLRYSGGLLLPIDGVSQTAEYCVVEATYLGDLKANLASASDTDIGLATGGQINRAVLEDMIGRVLNANELAAFGDNDTFALIS